MKTLKKSKDGFRKAQEQIYVNNGTFKNSTMLLRIIGERQRKVQSAVRETSWWFSVARADVRSGVQTRWLRFTVIVNHILPFSQMFLCLKWCQGLLNQKAFIDKSQTISDKMHKCWIYRVILQLRWGNEMRSLFTKQYASMCSSLSFYSFKLTDDQGCKNVIKVIMNNLVICSNLS